jgi:Xaa-Pro dipeptidase
MSEPVEDDPESALTYNPDSQPTLDLPLPPSSIAVAPSSIASAAPTPDKLDRRRADIDAKQERVGRILADLGCEGVVLLMPAHVAWFTGGMNVRGLIADNERPGVYTNGRQRWLLCSNIDTQRLFDEELDGLGFQLKEWQWTTGRAVLLGELVAGKKFATDRPFPNMPLINDALRPELRPLTGFEQELYRDLGAAVVHAVEATARNFERGSTEQEVAGHLAHRLVRRGAEAVALSVTADGRGKQFRRSGYTAAKVDRYCTLQATGCRDGLYVTASRTVWFEPPDAEFLAAFEAAVKVSAAYRALSRPGESIGTAGSAGKWVVANTPFEFEWRHSQPGYGAGRFPAEELRRMGQDERFGPGWPLVWQARVGPAAVVDTVVAADGGPVVITPPERWPFKRIKIDERHYDVPDILVRAG